MSALAAGRTFKRRERSAADAYADHAALRKAVDDYGRPIDEVEPLWAALTRRAETGDRLALCASHTMPDHVAPLVGTCEVAAAFAVVEILGAVAKGARTTAGDLAPSDLVLRAACRSAWAAFEARRLLANVVIEGFGCDESAAWHLLRDTDGDRDVQREMRAIADLAGLMHKAMGHVVRTVPTDDPQSIVGTRSGGDLDRLLPLEYARLADADLRDEQAMRVLGRRAQQYKMKGRRRMGRGPLVLALDESGSMHDGGGALDRNTWAKACAVALTRVAHEEGRHVRCVHFSTATVLQDVPVGDARALWEMAHSFLSGGTSIGTALDVSLRAVEALATEGKPGADVVLVSDGATGEQLDSRIDAMDKAGVALWSVAIGQEWGEKFAPRARAEKYVHVGDSSLSDKTGAAKLAADLSGAAIARDDLN